MHRFLLAGAALLAIPALAIAGKTATVGNNTLKVEAAYKPAKTSKKSQAVRPLRLSYDHFAGTVDGSGLPDFASITVRTGGPKFFFDAFPKCALSESGEDGAAACPEGSRVGEGKATAELHGETGNSDVEVDLQVFNGDIDFDREGDPQRPADGLLIFAELDGVPLSTIPMDALSRNTVAVQNPRQDPDPESSFSYGIKEIHLTIDKLTIRRSGRVVPFLGAPRKCRKAWKVATTAAPYEGEPIRATDKVSCKRV